MKELVLPSWATYTGNCKVEVDAASMYSELLEELGFSDVDQYSLVVAQKCAKMDIQVAVAGTKAAPKQGGALTIIIVDKDKDPESGSVWRFANFPEGDGQAAAAKDVRKHYTRIRGFSL